MKEKYSIQKSEFDILTPESVLANVPESAGVYLLWTKQSRGKWNCIHVGHSQNLRSNLLEHFSADGENSSLKSKVQKLICGYEWALISTAR